MVAVICFKDDRQSVRHGGCQEPSAVMFMGASKPGNCETFNKAQVGSQMLVTGSHGSRVHQVTRPVPDAFDNFAVNICPAMLAG